MYDPQNYTFGQLWIENLFADFGKAKLRGKKETRSKSRLPQMENSERESELVLLDEFSEVILKTPSPKDVSKKDTINE